MRAHELYASYIIAALMLSGFFCVPGLFSMPASAAQLEWTGDTTISSPMTRTGDIITVSGNLTISSSLTLIGTELRMNCSDNGCYTIVVKGTGTFNILASSNVHAVDPDAHFLFQVRNGGTLNMNASELHDCGWDDIENWTTNPQSDRGLFIESDRVSITNSTVSNNCVGITVESGRSPFIFRNNITDNDCSGIEVYSASTPVIDQNIIRGNIRQNINWQSGGISSDSSSPTITNNTITANIDVYQNGNSVGIMLVNGGSPVIMYNNITGHKQSANTNAAGIGGYSCSGVIYRNNISGNNVGMMVNSASCTVQENVFDNNKISGMPNAGWGVYDDGASTFTNNTYSRNTIGVCLVDGSTSSYENENITSNTRAGVDSDTWGRGYTVTMTNCTFSKNGQDVFLESPNGGGGGQSIVTLVNPSYNPALVKVTDLSATLKVQWFLRAKVIYENHSVIVEGAEVNATTLKGTNAEQALTGPDGWTPTMLLEEYSKSSGSTNSKSPYRIHATKDAITNYTEVVLTTNRDVTVVLDDIDPTISISGPKNGYLTNQSSVRIWGVCEPGSNVTINGVQGTVASNGTWSATVPLEAEGANELLAEAADAALNTARDAITVFRDTISPVVSISAPATGFLTNKTTITVEGATSDLAAVTTVNGATVEPAANGSFRITVELAEGGNLITAESRDASGNIGRAFVWGTMDSLAPLLQVIEPREGYKTNRSSLWIRGNIEDGASLSMNGRIIKIDGETFSIEATLEEGINTYNFIAKDKAGNVNTSQLVVKKDSLAPILVISSPTDNALVNSSTLFITGRTEAGASLRINDEIIEFEGASFNITVELAVQGRNTFVLEVFDDLGNLASRTLNVNLDDIAPPLTLRSPANNSLTNLTVMELKGRTDPGTIIKVNGVRTWVDKDGCFTADIELLQEGANTFVVVASDLAGNTVQSQVTVIRDTVVNYTLTSPKNGITVKTRNITVSGKVEPGSTVSISGTTISPKVDGSFSFDLQLLDGPNLISVTMKDKAGNTASETIQVTKLKAPKMTVAKGFIPGFEGPAMLAGLALVLVILSMVRRDRNR